LRVQDNTADAAVHIALGEKNARVCGPGAWFETMVTGWKNQRE
jgi:hypothetical protein